MTTTYHGVGRAAREVCDRIAEREGAIELVFMHGFPYADNPSVGHHTVQRGAPAHTVHVSESDGSE